MPFGSVETVVYGGLALFAAAGVGAAAISYVLVPWQRLNEMGRFPSEPRTVELMRLGVTVGFLLVVPMVVGMWAYYRSIVPSPGTMAGHPPLADRIALALPGELVALGSFLLAVAAMLIPLGLSVRDTIAALLGRREV